MEGKTKLLVYTSVTCGFCKRMKEWLAEEGIEYVDKDLQDAKNMKELTVDHKQTKVPFVVYGDKKWSGFSEKTKEEIKEAIQ